MKEVLINSLSISNYLSFTCFVILEMDSTHIPPLPANLMLGCANRGCWRDPTKRYPDSSFWLVVFFDGTNHPHPWQVSCNQCSKVTISDWLAAPLLSFSLVPPVLSGTGFLQLLLSQFLQLNNSLQNPSKVTSVASDS